MTISNETVSVSHNGNASTSLFAISGISFTDNADIDVYIRDVGESPPTEALKTITTHYFMTDGSGNQTNPATHIKFDTGSSHSIPAADQKVVIKRKIALTQSTDYVSGASFSADSHESALDKLTLLIQQMQEQLSRAWLFPETYSTLSNVKMPEPGNNAVIRWNSDSTALIADLSLATATYKVSPSADDTTADYLDQKLKAGTGLSASTVNPGGDEEYTFAIDSTVTTLTGTQILTNKRLNSPKLNEDVVVSATATELNLLDGVSGLVQADFTKLAAVDASAAEINILDGDTGASTVTLADADRIVVNDDGTMKQVALTAFETYFESVLDTLSVTSVGALNSGSITSGFGSINVGSSSVTAGSAVIDSTIGHTDDTDLMTLADASLTVKGTVTVGVDDTGHDVKFFGAESGSHLLWDESDNSLETAGNATINVVKDKLLIGGTAVTTTAAELNLLDGVSGLAQADFTKLAAVDSTAGELNLLDGSAKSTSSITIADDDAFLVIDGTTSKQIPASDIKTYAGGGGGVGSIDTIFTMQAKTASAASAASGDDAVFRGAAASVTSAPALVTTAGNLINTDKVFKYTSASNSTNDWWLYSESIPQGYQNRNMVLQLQYYMVETSGDNLTNAFRFVARDATNGKVTQLNGAVSSSNTITLDAFADGDFTVGDRVTFKDTGGAIHFRYITSVTHGSEQLTISGAAVTIADDAYFVSGILTDELDYLPNFKPTTAGQDGSKAYKKQLVIPSNCDTLEFGFHYLGSQTDQFLYYDDIALSANQFLQTPSQGQTENYSFPYATNMLLNDDAGDLEQLHATLLSNSGSSAWSLRGHTPALADSKLINIHNVSTQTRFEARQDIEVSVSLTYTSTDNSSVQIKNSSGGQIALSENDAGEDSWEAVSSTFLLNKGDYFTFMTPSPANTAGAMSLNLTPKINDVVLLNSQSETFTDWVDNGKFSDSVKAYGSGSGGTDPTAGSTNVDTYKWRRDGSDMIIYIAFDQSSGGTTGSGGDYIVEMPSGYVADSGFYTFGPTTSFGGGNGNNWYAYNDIGGGQVNDDASGTTNGWLRGFLVEEDKFKFGFGVNYGATANWYGCMGSAAYAFDLTNAGYTALLRVKIAGWTSTFNPVLSMPLVDFGTFENTYSARFDGGASTSDASRILSQSTTFVASIVEDPGDGRFIITWTSGFFPVVPSCVVSVENAENSDKVINVHTVTTTGCKVSIESSGDQAPSAANFNLTVTRQGSDYRQQPQPTAAVIKPAVAIGKIQLPLNTAGGNSANDGYNQRKFNTWYGETWFVSGFDGTLGTNGTTDQFDLDPGMYKVSGSTISYQADSSFSVMDSTDNSVIIEGLRCYPSDGVSATADNPFAGVFTITEKKTFKIWTYTYSPETTYGLGVQANQGTRPEVYGQVIIEKLK